MPRRGLEIIQVNPFFFHEALRQVFRSKVRRDAHIKILFLAIERNQEICLEDQALITFKTGGVA